MENLKIEEIAKLEHCECESPCGACLEKYAHVFEKDKENIASVSVTNITGDAIANYILKPKEDTKTDAENIVEIKEQIKKLQEQVAIILMNLK
jgi:ferredoxin